MTLFYNFLLFRSYEQKIIRKRTKDTFSMINKFEVDEKNMEEKAEEEMKKNRFCAQVIFFVKVSYF